MTKEHPDRKNFANVLIPTSLYEKIKNRIKGTRFASVSDYVTYVLNELLTEREEERFTKEDEEKIKARLKALGYIE